MTVTLARDRLRAARARFDLVRLAVASAVFWLAFDHGSFTTGQRAAVGVVVWWAIAVVVVGGLMRFRPGPLGGIAVGALLALAALDLSSVFWSHDPTSAVAEFERVLVYAGIAIVALIACAAFGVAAIADGIAGGIAAIAFLSLASRCFPSISADRSPPTFVALSQNRLSYPLDYWNGLAIFVALALPLLIWHASSPNSAPWRRALAVAPVPAIIAVIYLASSRGGAAVALVGSVVFFVATDRRWRVCASGAVAAGAAAGGVLLLQHSPRLVNGPLGTAASRAEGHRAAWVFVGLCVAAGVGQFVLTGLEPAEPRSRRALGRSLAGAAVCGVVAAMIALHPIAQFHEFTRPPHPGNATIQTHLLAANGSGRWQQWAAAVNEWEKHPLLGGGAGSYYRWWLQHGSLALQVRNAHSLYLETLGELGGVGFVLLVVALGAGLVAGACRVLAGGNRRHLAAAVLGSYCGFLVGAGIDWIWQLAAVGAVGVCLLGMLTVGCPGVRGGWPAPALAGGGFVIALFMIILLLGESRLSDSYTAASDGRLAEAAADASVAQRLEPWATPPLLQLALIQEQRGDLPDARRFVRLALDRDHGDWQLWLVSARLDLELGRGALARAALLRAASLNPDSSLFYRLKLAK